MEYLETDELEPEVGLRETDDVNEPTFEMDFGETVPQADGDPVFILEI